MKIVLCDDQKTILYQLRQSLQKFDEENNMINQLVYFEKPSMLYEYMKKEKVDMVFMDLDFREEAEDGISWVKKIRKQYPSTIIIILTSYEKRYKEGFEARAFRFMTKPIEETELFDYLNAGMKELQLVDSISIVRRGIPREILLKDICYFSAQSGGSELWTKTDVFCCEESLLKWEKSLPADIFFRCHSKYLVNLSHVTDFDRHMLILDNGEKIPVSRRRWKDFQLAYMKFDTKLFMG